ncbi:Hmp Flavodoxin reductases (ferredoxin-NADPH reductases) family 1 [Burkholderiaceae bacterium]
MSHFSLAAAPLSALRVRRKHPIAREIVRFELTHPQGQDLPDWSAGAHIRLSTPQGHIRSYSLCGPVEARDHWAIAVKREANGRGGSASLIDEVHEGDELPLHGGDNLFALDPQAPEHILIAGGIGLTPLYAMAQTLAQTPAAKFHLYVCSRDAEGTAFLNELQQAPWRDHVTIHHDAGDPSQALDLWPLLETPSAAHVYCCGPQGLMDCVRDMSGHWPTHHIHFESFGASQQGWAENQAFEVVLRHSGQRITVPADRSILESLRQAGVRVASSCESGTCGSCKTGLLAGAVEHRDLVLLADEQATHLMPCVSRSVGGATLELDL